MEDEKKGEEEEEEELSGEGAGAAGRAASNVISGIRLAGRIGIDRKRMCGRK